MSRLTAPDPAKSVLLTIDVQQDFTNPGAVAEIPGTSACVPAMRRIVEAYRQRHLPIVHVVRLYLADGTNVDLCRRDAIAAGSATVRPHSLGAELVDRSDRGMAFHTQVSLQKRLGEDCGLGGVAATASGDLWRHLGDLSR